MDMKLNDDQTEAVRDAQHLVHAVANGAESLSDLIDSHCYRRSAEPDELFRLSDRISSLIDELTKANRHLRGVGSDLVAIKDGAA